MKPLLLLSVLAAPLLAPPAAAQGAAATPNRRPAGISIVEEGGSPVLRAAVQVQLPEATSVPLDLSTDVFFFVEGASVGTVHLDLAVEPASFGCGFPGSCYGGCGFGAWGLYGCAIHIPTGTHCVCSGSTLAALPLDPAALQPGDEILVLLRPSPGAVPDADTGDDTLVATAKASPTGAPELGWRRALGPDSLTVVPAASAEADSFFDVWTEVELLHVGDQGALDLSFSLELQVGGVVVATQEVAAFEEDAGATTAVFAAVPAEPGEELVVLLVPAPGALPELPGFEDEDEARVVVPTLFADPSVLSLGAGGAQAFTLAAGAAHGGALYLLLGSLSGTVPGFDLGAHVPLNVDAWLLYTASAPNLPPYAGSLGTLDAAGGGAAKLAVPAGAAPGLAGATAHHAYVLLDLGLGVATFASNPVDLTLLP